MADEAIKQCSCELCHPNLWLGAFDEHLDKKAANQVDRLEEEHRQKIAAARRERLAFVAG